MAQLRQQGWMHHLARHSVACFLTRGDLWCRWGGGRGLRAQPTAWPGPAEAWTAAAAAGAGTPPAGATKPAGRLSPGSLTNRLRQALLNFNTPLLLSMLPQLGGWPGGV